MEKQISIGKQKYLDYLKSEEWYNLKIDLLQNRGCKCEKCGTKKSPTMLQVHHKTYIRLYDELASDLILLCGVCHMKEHEIFKEKIKPKRNKNICVFKKTTPIPIHIIFKNNWTKKFRWHLEVFSIGLYTKQQIISILYSLFKVYKKLCDEKKLFVDFKVERKHKLAIKLINADSFEANRFIYYCNKRRICYKIPSLNIKDLKKDFKKSNKP
jgi:hypothetical protein